MTTDDPCHHRTDRSRGAFLSDVRVVELGASHAVRAAGRILAQMGADVLVADERGRVGDRYLDEGKRVRSFVWGEASESVGLGAALSDLLAGSDIVLDDFRPDHPSASRRRAVDDVAAARGDLVVTTITPYGLSGHRRGDEASDAVVAAFSGLAHLTPRDIVRSGDAWDQPPLPMPGRLVSTYGGLAATSATLAALRHRRLGGRGQHVDVSLLEALVPTLRRELALAHLEGEVASRFMRVWRLAPWGVKPCADGFVFVQVVERHHWLALVELMGSPTWALDADLLDPVTRFDRRAEIERLMAPWLAQQRKADLAEAAQSKGLPFAPVSEPSDLLQIPQVRHRAFVDTEATDSLRLRLPYLVTDTTSPRRSA